MVIFKFSFNQSLEIFKKLLVN